MKHLPAALLLFAAASHAQTPAPTWTQQIAPIVYANCLSCHHTGGSAPFDLSTYTQARRWAPQILDVTQSRYMPPWLPAPGHGHFAGDRSMSPADIAAIKAWVNAGTPIGPGPTPKAPVYTSSWSLGPPDLVVEMPTAIHVPASGTDLFMNFVLPTALTRTRWVRAMEIKPGGSQRDAAQVTHHANLILDRTQSVRRQHPTDWQLGVPGMDILVDSGDDFDPDSHFLFWKPDSTALVEDPTMPWRLDPGNDLVLNMHLKPTGKPETLRARIGLYFTDTPATQLPMLLQLENDAALDIPPGDPSFTITDELTLPVAVSVLGVYPHAHYLGKRLEAWAELPATPATPSGTRKDLILIPDWDIDRQSVYRLAEPLPLPAGTVVHMRYTYDNSTANLRNPHNPPVRVRAGNRSEDEMGHLWLQVLPAPSKPGDPDPRLALERAWMQNRLRKSPEDQIALYNLAAMATESGDPAEAESLYRRLLAHNPQGSDAARTLTSLGAALVAEGDWQAAMVKFHTALQLDPTYTDAAFDLASLDLQHPEQPNAVPEAEQLLIQLTSAHPQDAPSLRLLAMAYAADPAEGQLAKALTPLHAWAALTPMDPEPRRALAQVYTQLSQPIEALREQRAVVALATSSASDWNDLGVMEARSGNPTAARKDFTHALELDPTLAAARTNLSKL